MAEKTKTLELRPAIEPDEDADELGFPSYANLLETALRQPTTKAGFSIDEMTERHVALEKVAAALEAEAEEVELTEKEFLIIHQFYRLMRYDGVYPHQIAFFKYLDAIKRSQ